MPWSTVSPTDIIYQDAAASRWVSSDDAGEPLTVTPIRSITANVGAHCLPRAQQATVAVLAGMGAQRVR